MFTGIVEEVGRVIALREEAGGWHLTVRAGVSAEGAALGASIAINGVCLTITEIADHTLTFGLAPETLRRSNLGDVNPGDGVNLERPLRANGRVDGHFVQGHVDGTGTLLEMRPDGDALHITVGADPTLLRYMVPKGYIAVDGASLTIIDVLEDRFTFMLIAYTQSHIAVPEKPIGAKVNLEADMLAKYAERFMTLPSAQG